MNNSNRKVSVFISCCVIFLSACLDSVEITNLSQATITNSQASPTFAAAPTQKTIPTRQPVQPTLSTATIPATEISPTPDPKIIFPPTPTISKNLLQPIAMDGLTLPEGLRVEIYKMAHGPFPDEGYEPIIRSLGERSLLQSLTQGRYYWDTADLALLEANNAALAPFGYKLVSKPVEQGTGSRWYTLFQDDRIMLDPVMLVGKTSVNRSKDDFFLNVWGENKYYILRKDGLEPWQQGSSTMDSTTPRFLGDDIMVVEIEQRISKTPEPGITQISVKKNGAIIFSKSFQSQSISSGFYGLWTYDNHWAIETVDEVVIDGSEINANFGFDKSFGFHLLDDKPLFFYEKSGEIGVNFAGMSAILPFDAIPHYGCCSAGANNPEQIGNMLIFYGKQNGTWFYVEMTDK